MGIGFLKKNEAEELDSGLEFSQNKELRKLKKSELLEIMLKQGEEIDRLNKRIETLEKELADRKIKIAKAGTMAEAALALNGVFEAADKAVRQYLENVGDRIDDK